MFRKGYSIINVDREFLLSRGLKQTLEMNLKVKSFIRLNYLVDAYKLLKWKPHDLLVINLQHFGPEESDIIHTIKMRYEDIKIIHLSNALNVISVNNGLDAGIDGFISKKDLKEDNLVDGIRKVMEGEKYFDPCVQKSNNEEYVVCNYHQQFVEKISLLSKREREVMRFIALNKSSKEISQLLHISQRTIENHRYNICRKLEINGHNSLVRFAYQFRQNMLDAMSSLEVNGGSAYSLIPNIYRTRFTLR